MPLISRVLQACRSNPWAYLALAVGLTWAFWVPAAFSSHHFLLQILGGVCGAALPPILVTSLACTREERRDYWVRLIDPKRIGGRWWAVILLAYPLFGAIGATGHVLAGGNLSFLEAAAGYLASPLKLLPLAGGLLLFGPLPEEISWRGFALDRLQARYSALASGLMLGLVWSLWHLPLFFVEDTYQQTELPPGSVRFFLFFITLIAESVITSWIYNATNRSTLSAVLFHFMANFMGQFLNLPDGAERYKSLAIVAAAGVLAAVYGPRLASPRAPSVKPAA